AIQAQINQFNGSLPTREDREDMWQEITMGLLRIPSPSNRGVGYVLRSIQNIAIKAIQRAVGLHPNAKNAAASDRQLTDPLETDGAVLADAQVSYDPAVDLTLAEVRRR